jgi:uncharacterized protein GlcG (DUF336 family)
MAGHSYKDGPGRRKGGAPGVEGLEARDMPAVVPPFPTPPLSNAELTQADVQTILQRAAEATASDDAIVAVVDRGGNILGVRVEGNVSPAITSDPVKLTFAIDGALAEARTGAFFANNQAPLTSRTIQDISQSTITQREVQSNPDITDPNSTLRGPGFVAPVGLKGHFPPRIQFTPQVDLFQIEQTNRDSIISPGPDHIRGTADDIRLRSRFNVNPAFIPPGQGINAPESYGFVSGLLPDAQSRGIGTLPGGIPLVKKDAQGNAGIVGGVGVFFPGTTGFATEENSSLNEDGLFNPAKVDRSVEAEFVAFFAAGGSSGPQGAGIAFKGKPLNQIAPAVPAFNIPFGRIDLVGISLDIVGPHGRQGPKNLADYAAQHFLIGKGDPNSGSNYRVVADPALPLAVPASTPLATQAGGYLMAGQAVPQGWLVLPHDAEDGSGLTAADVTAIIDRGIAEAHQVRAAIRLPLDRRAAMMLAVTDKSGNVLGLFRMPDTTFFSIDVAVAKARNVAYYANPAELQPIDQVPGVPAGTAFTNRTFRYLAQPRFPEGIDGYPPGPFSILNDGGTVLDKATLAGPPLPASAFQSVQGFAAFNPQSNFHDPFNVANQNGIVFFPGSAPLYKDINGTGVRQLVGGLGISGDGVDQDDDVTFAAAVGYEPPFTVRRADQVKVRGIRLPYQKFNRQPHEPYFDSPAQLPEPPFHGFKQILPRAKVFAIPFQAQKPGSK